MTVLMKAAMLLLLHEFTVAVYQVEDLLHCFGADAVRQLLLLLPDLV